MVRFYAGADDQRRPARVAQVSAAMRELHKPRRL